MVVILVDAAVLTLINLVQHARHLLLEQLLQLLLGLLVQVVLHAEVDRELLSGVTLVHDDTLLLAAAEIDVDEEQRLVLALEFLAAGLLSAQLRRLRG